MHSATLSLAGIQKAYGPRVILRDVSFDVEPGSVTGIVGANGAGKTTTMAILSGQIAPDRGEIRLDGGVMRPGDLMAATALIPETPVLYPTLTPREHLRFVALGRRLPPSSVERANALAERLNLATYLDRPAASLSKGNRQKTLIACALLADTPVLLLDEPFIGLDPPAQAELLLLIAEVRASGRAIVLTTHVLEFAVRSCDSIVALRGGDVRFVDAALPDALERLQSVFAP